jgi:hypothetical protein
MKPSTSRPFSTGIALAIVLALLFAINAHAAKYYEEPPSTMPYAKLAYMAERMHVLVGSIDGDAVLGDKPPQRLMALEGAASDKYLRIKPGKHELRMRVFYKEQGGIKEMSEVSAIDFEFQAGRTYYPIAEKTPMGNGKVKTSFTIVDKTDSGRPDIPANAIVGQKLEKLFNQKKLDKIALFRDVKNKGDAADILAKVIDSKTINDLVNSKSIGDVIKGTNYLNRVGTLNERTIVADQGELYQILALNGEFDEKYSWLWNEKSTEKAIPVTDENFKNIIFTFNKKTYAFDKFGEQFVLMLKEN